MSEHVPLRVTAHLEAGLAHAHDWGIALDGLLASAMHHHAKAQLLHGGGEHVPLRHQDLPADLDLPLARCEHSAPDWHWAATCSCPVDGHDIPTQVVRWSARHDHRITTSLTSRLPRTVEDQRGRYRSHWMPLMVTLTSAVTFDAVGDLEQIRDLLTPIAAIGKKRASGHGRVLRWQVEPTDRDPFAAAHLHPDGTLGRPAPIACAPHLGPAQLADQGPRRGSAGLRPPYTHPSRIRELALPASTHDQGAA